MTPDLTPDLTNRGNGFVARRLRERLAATPVGRVPTMERRVGALERTMALDVRGFRGVRIEQQQVQIVPSSDGWLMFSTDDSLTIDRDPNQNPHHAKWKLDEGAGGGGCEASITTIEDHQGTSQTADACDASLAFTDGNGYLCFKHVGSKNAQILETHWCAPQGVGPPPAGATTWRYGDPVIWIEIAVGDECGGACTTYCVPAWECAGG